MIMEEWKMNLTELNLKEVLLTGIDPGNDGAKTSYLTEDLTIESFTIPTVIAKAESDQVRVQPKNVLNKIGEQKSFVDDLYLHIKSKALPKGYQDSYFFVGTSAIDKPNRVQPDVKQDGKAEDKQDSLLHNVIFLSSLAVAAFKTNREKVYVPISMGLPIEEHKAIEDTNKIIERFIGEHEFEAKDGEFAGKKTKIIVTDGQIGIEGITSILALQFDVKDKELVETEYSQVLEGDFALADCGAGTLDKAIYENGELNSYASTNSFIGTNKVIDDLLEEITNAKEFEAIRNRFAKANVAVAPYRTRGEFITKVIKPEINKMIEDNSYQPKFVAKWANVEIDVTKIVKGSMEEYGKAVEQELIEFWSQVPQATMFIMVGGGVLFGYHYFRNLVDFNFPPNVKESPYFTSKAYLLANIVTEIEKQFQAA